MSGGTPKKDDPVYWGGDIPWISANSMHGTRYKNSDLKLTEEGLANGSRLAPKDAVLLLVRGGALHNRIPIGIAERPVAFNQDVKAIVAKEDLIRPWFLLSWLMGHERYLLSSVVEYTGIGAGKLDTKRMQSLTMLLPSLDEQDEIVTVAKALDDCITLLRETNATLEAIAQALFKSWFVDFDPVRAKMEGRTPEGMDEATVALFPDGFETSELGEMPRGWQAGPLSAQVEGVYDGPHATPPDATEGGVFLGIKNLTGTALDLSDVRYIAESDWERWTKRITPRARDIVFSYEATLGFFALIPPDLRCCLGRRLALVRPKERDGFPHFWFHQFVAAPFQALLEKHTIHGATVNRIALKSFPDLPVLVPPIELRRAFDSTVAELWERIHCNGAQVATLSTLRDTLLPRLISGQLRLPEAEANLSSEVTV